MDLADDAWLGPGVRLLVRAIRGLAPTARDGTWRTALSNFEEVVTGIGVIPLRSCPVVGSKPPATSVFFGFASRRLDGGGAQVDRS